MLVEHVFLNVVLPQRYVFTPGTRVPHGTEVQSSVTFHVALHTARVIAHRAPQTLPDAVPRSGVIREFHRLATGEIAVFAPSDTVAMATFVVATQTRLVVGGERTLEAGEFLRGARVLRRVSVEFATLGERATAHRATVRPLGGVREEVRHEITERLHGVVADVATVRLVDLQRVELPSFVV